LKEKDMSQKGKQLAIWGAAMQLGTLVGLIGTITGIVRAFGHMTESEMAEAALAKYISIALYTAAGSLIALVGIALILVALFGARYRAPWFQKALWVFSVLWLLSYPIGTILGIVAIVYLIKHKTEFTGQKPASTSVSSPQPAAPPECMRADDGLPHMKRRTKVIIGIAGGVWACLYIAFIAMNALGALLLGGLTKALVSPPPKPAVGIVGTEMHAETRACYDFVCRATGLDFPKGTQVDAYDTGYDLIIACFSLPPEEAGPFLNSNLTVAPLKESVVIQGITNLTVQSQNIPETLSTGLLRTTNTWQYPIAIYVNPQMGKLWVECHYQGWFD
jgi:hypothetical protein